MEALKEIGWAKAIRFVIYALVAAFLRIVLIPQIRVSILRALGAKVGADTIIHNVTFSNLYHYGFERLSMGSRCFIGEEVLLDCRGLIKLGSNVTISDRASLVTHINVGYKSHPLQRLYPTAEGRIRIGDGVYVGTGAIILPNVTIGPRCVIGAGAVVTGDVAANTVVAGVPARVVKRLI